MSLRIDVTKHARKEGETPFYTPRQRAALESIPFRAEVGSYQPGAAEAVAAAVASA